MYGPSHFCKSIKQILHAIPPGRNILQKFFNWHIHTLLSLSQGISCYSAMLEICNQSLTSIQQPFNRIHFKAIFNTQLNEVSCTINALPVKLTLNTLSTILHIAPLIMNNTNNLITTNIKI